MNNTQSRNQSIEDIVKLIEENQLLLPEFQRDFKWPIDKSEILFDSIFQDLFIGSIILSKPKFDLACKNFDLRKRGTKKDKPTAKLFTEREFETKGIYALLDGQQRITAIYRALRGDDTIYVVLKPVTDLKNNYYNPNANKKVLCGKYDMIASFESNKPEDGRLYLTISDMYKANVNSMRDKEITHDFITPRFEEGIYNDEEKAVLEEFSLVLFTFFSTDIIKKSNLLSVQLLEMDLEKFCLYFERSNSQGLNLSFTDIVTAKVYTEFKLGESIKENIKKYPEYFSEKHVDGLVRFINYKANSEVTKTSILKELKGDHFKRYWDEAISDLVKVQKWLIENNWLFSLSTLPYKTLLLPIMIFYQNLKYKEFTQATPIQLAQLEFWFYSSLMDYRYGGARHGSTNVVLKKDLERFASLGKGINIPADYWQEIKIEYTYAELLKTDNNSNAKAIGISYYLWKNHQFLNLENKHKVSFSSDVDVHHVFPSNYLKRTFGSNSEEYDISDTFLNKIRINKIANIKISDKSPGAYLTEISQSNKKIEISLASHSINNCKELIDGNLDIQFTDFLSNRYRIISDELAPLKEKLECLSRAIYT